MSTFRCLLALVALWGFACASLAAAPTPAECLQGVGPGAGGGEWVVVAPAAPGDMYAEVLAGDSGALAAQYITTYEPNPALGNGCMGVGVVGIGDTVYVGPMPYFDEATQTHLEAPTTVYIRLLSAGTTDPAAAGDAAQVAALLQVFGAGLGLCALVWGMRKIHDLLMHGRTD